MATRNSSGSGGEILLYQTEDGRTRIECRFENDTLWLTQALMAQLFQVTLPTANEHLKCLCTDGELRQAATIRKFRIVRSEGSRQVTREIERYNLEAIPAVGFRVRSQRGTQFRRWAALRLREYLHKGCSTTNGRRIRRAQASPTTSTSCLNASATLARARSGHA